MAAVSTTTSALANARASKARPCTRARVVCASAPADRPALASRRVAAASLAFLPASLIALQAAAILPDEDDEEMINKAKANRRNRLAQQADVAKEYIKTEGIVNRELQQELVPVQNAVYKLAKAGSQIEKGDVTAAAATVSEAWVSEFESAAGGASTNPAAKAALTLVTTALAGLKAAAGKGDAGLAKAAYVGSVDALESWAVAAAVAGDLKGL